MDSNDLKAINNNANYLFQIENETKYLAEILKSILENNVNDDKKISYLKTLEKIINGTFKITD